MGTTNFENDYRGPATMEQAYQELVNDAFYDQGHDPYNGTISTTHGCMQDPEVKAPMTAEQVREHLKDWWDKDEQPQKWGAAWAIPLAPDDSGQPGWLFYGWAAC